MLEFIQFYSKNIIHLFVFMIIGFVIAILDISIRKIVKKVYLNVRTNMKNQHGGSDFIREGLVDSASIDKFEEKTKEESGSKDKGKGKGKGKGDGKGGEGEEGGDGGCPEDCSAVMILRKRLTELIIDATKLKDDVKENNLIIKKQQEIIDELKINVQDLIKASKE
jgi:hypothetical protein